MKTSKLTIVLAVVGLMLWAFALVSVAAESKVGVIDLNQVIQSSMAGKQANAVLLEFTRVRQSNLTALTTRADELRKELEKAASTTDRANWQAELDRATATLNQEKTAVQNDINQRILELRQPIIADIGRILNLIATTDGFSIFLDIGSVIYFDKSADVTWEVVRKYDAAYEAMLKNQATPKP